MVKIVIGNIESKIVGHLPESVQNDLNDILAYKVQGARHIPSVKNHKWDGIIRLYHRSKGQSFYTGLMSFVRDTLNAHAVDFTMVDYRERPEPNYLDLKFSPPAHYSERDYQNFTVDRAVKFTRGVLSVCTGGGKTMMVTRIIDQIKTYPFIFYVLTKDLMEQAHDVLSTCFNVPIGRVGDGHADIQKITVVTVQTAIRALDYGNTKLKVSDYKFDEEDSWDEKGIENSEKADRIRKLIRSARGIYFDETHHAAAQTCRKVLSESVNAYWRFGGSATPYRESGDEIMIQAMFGAKIVDIPASYLIKRDFLVKPYIIFDPIDSSVKLHSYPKILKHCITHNDILNTHVADVGNHLVSRGKSTLVLVKHYPQGEFIKNLMPNTPFVTGKMSTAKRKAAIDDLREGRIMSMIATSLADEGLDIPTLDSAIDAGGSASSTRVNQRIGRTLRKDLEGRKDRSIYIYPEHIKTRYLKDHAKKVRTFLKREPEFQIIDSKGSEFICDEIDQLLGLRGNTICDLF